MHERALFADYPADQEPNYPWVWVACEVCGAMNSALATEITLTVCGYCGAGMEPDE